MDCHRGLCIWFFQRYTRPNPAHTTIFIISFFSLFVDNESVMVYPSTTVLKKNCTGELANRAPTVDFLTCQVRAASRSVYAMAPGKRLPLQWSQWESCYQLPSHTLWIKCRGIWIKGCITMSTLEVCSFGILSKCLCGRRKGKQFWGTWGLCCSLRPHPLKALTHGYIGSPISGNHELGCLILHRVPKDVLNTKLV